jgi:hypothetical protein
MMTAEQLFRSLKLITKELEKEYDKMSESEKSSFDDLVFEYLLRWQIHQIYATKKEDKKTLIEQLNIAVKEERFEDAERLKKELEKGGNK